MRLPFCLPACHSDFLLIAFAQLGSNSTQLRWLKSDLSAVDRSKTPWVVVGMHRGMYVDDPSESGPESPSATLQEQVERLLVEKSVDLVLNGHTRVYHHSCPIIQGYCVGYSTDGTAKGPVHAMLGIGGAAIPLRANAAAPFWVVQESFEHGVAQLVADKTSLTLQVCGLGGEGSGVSLPATHSLILPATHSLVQCHSLSLTHSMSLTRSLPFIQSRMYTTHPHCCPGCPTGHVLPHRSGGVQLHPHKASSLETRPDSSSTALCNPAERPRPQAANSRAVSTGSSGRRGQQQQ